MPAILFLSSLLMIWINYRITNRAVNVISVLIFPYAILVPLNNYVMYRFGFYKISDEVIVMIIGAFICVFIGSIAADSLRFRIKNEVNEASIVKEAGKEDTYRWGKMFHFTLFVDAVTLIRFLIIVKSHGVSYIGSEAFSGVLTSGPLGHLLLSITPLLPPMFFYWLKHKYKIKYLIVFGISIVLFFLTFVKYHVIGIVIATYLFTAYEDREYFRKGGILLLITGIAIFVLNYLLSFFLRGVAGNVSSRYYFLHFWNYSAGSLIYDNRIFGQGVRVGTSIFYKLGTFLFAPINLFTSALFGYRFFPHENQFHYPVGSNGEVGNVVDAIGYLYPSRGTVSDMILFAVIMVIIGWLLTHIYNSHSVSCEKRGVYPTFLAYFLSYFISLSFFGTFYINSIPYEILFWSWLMMKIFDDRVVIRFGKARL